MTTFRCDVCHKLMRGPDLMTEKEQRCPRCDSGWLYPVRVTEEMREQAEVAREGTS